FLLVELFKLLWSKILRDDVARHELAVADCSQQIVDPAVAVVARDALHVLISIAEQLLRRELKTRRFLLKQLAPDLHRLGALLLGHPVANAIARPRSDDKVQPIARRMSVGRRQDLDD